MPKILGPNGHPLRGEPRAQVRAKYDAAQISPETQAHWANADGLSALAANSPDVRRRLRDRARMETANNGYAKGITKRVAETVIGTGPRLQVQTPDRDLNRRVELDFARWTMAVGLAAKLRTMRMARMTDGEAFALLDTNPRLPTPVQLDVRLVEADQVSTPNLFWPTATKVDGIEFDAYGNPSAYHVLKQHPGDTIWFSMPWEYDTVPASMVIHWFVAERPGQRRGVPEITAALPLFAQLRRYTLATLSAAEIAALFAAILKSNLPPDEDTAGLTPFDTQALQRGLMTALPDGYDFAQLRAEQPTTTYKEFKHEIINEAASGVSVPSNIALCDSSQYNYSSSQLDKQWFQRAVDIDQHFAESVVMEPIFAAWFAEYRGITPLGADESDLVAQSPRCWHWDAVEHVDPEKEANAQSTRLKNGTTTLAIEAARAGYDWREIADQQAEERTYYEDLGIPYPGETVPPPAAPPPGPNGSAPAYGPAAAAAARSSVLAGDYIQDEHGRFAGSHPGGAKDTGTAEDKADGSSKVSMSRELEDQSQAEAFKAIDEYGDKSETILEFPRVTDPDGNTHEIAVQKNALYGRVYEESKFIAVRTAYDAKGAKSDHEVLKNTNKYSTAVKAAEREHKMRVRESRR